MVGNGHILTVGRSTGRSKLTIFAAYGYNFEKPINRVFSWLFCTTIFESFSSNLSKCFYSKFKRSFWLKVLICVFKGWKFKEKSLLGIGFLAYILDIHLVFSQEFSLRFHLPNSLFFLTT